MKNFEFPEWPELYDALYENYRIDFDFYMAQAEAAPGPILEVACGTGRLLLPMLERGLDVTGVDVSAPMLARLLQKATARGLTPTVHQADMRTFALNRKFALILVPFRSFLHLETTDDQLQALRNFHHHLTDGGQLLLNFFYPSLRVTLRQAGQREQGEVFTHPRTGRRVVRWIVVRNDLVNQMKYVDNIFEELDEEGQVVDRLCLPFTIRWIYKPEFELLLRLAGFRRYEVFGGFRGEPLRHDHQEMVWRAWK